MKTTNFFIDFIVVGVIGLLALLLPFGLLNPGLPSKLLSQTDAIIKLTPVLAVTTYAFGVLFNQISDRVDDILAKLPFESLRKAESALAQLQADLGRADHDCVQYIVLRSSAAYEYLSFRRSVLRIIRALLTMCILVILLHAAAAGVLQVRGADVRWDWRNARVIAAIVALMPFLVYTLQKLGVGYANAIRNFYTTLQTLSAKDVN